MDFETLALEHKDAVYRQLLRMCRNREDAEDVLIEALVKAYRSLHELRDPAAFQAWLAQIARRTYSRMKKRQALHPMLALDSIPPASPELASEAIPPDEAAMEGEIEMLLRQAMESLPETYRVVYELHDIEQLVVRDVAARLGLTVPAVKSRLHRAREMIRNHLDQALHTPHQ